MKSGIDTKSHDLCRTIRRLGACAGLVAAFALPAAARAESPLAPLAREYAADAESLSSFYNSRWMDARLDRMEKFHAGWLARLADVDFAALDATGRVDYVLLRNDCEQSLARLALECRRLKEIEPLVGFRGAIFDLEQARWRAEPVDGPVAASRLSAIAKDVKRLREGVVNGLKTKAGKPDGVKPPDTKPANAAASTNDAPPIAIEPAPALRAAGVVADVKGVLKRWYEAQSGYQPDFAWWMKTPYEAAAKELDEFAKALKEEVAGQKGKDEDPLVGEPLGPGDLADALRFEFLPQTADELIAIAGREIAACETALKAAAKAMKCGDDWKAALAKVKADYVPPGQQDALVAAIGREAIEFTRRKAFATVPPLCEETWRMAMLSPEAIRTVPYAAYASQEMLVAFAREDMKQEDKLMVMRGNNRHATRLTTPHELVPGHHLQIYQAARHSAHRRAFGTAFFIEGWALYCERRLWDLGWARSPEERLGMLFWRMNRAARVVVALRFHLGQMKPDEMVAFMVDRVGHEKLGATSEVRRFVGPMGELQPASYMVGCFQLLALRAEMTGRGKWGEMPFNDALLRAGPIAVELMRAELRDLPLARDAKPSWRWDAEPAGT
ncbi:MAG: hypothetical protein BWK77_02680 [Verrucomicrobia bacterium A1]|nr:MAG: hypothetical protein BWK77_02680 [Verrucomicrobia bacterium A1]